jgi:hypothetical protein
MDKGKSLKQSARSTLPVSESHRKKNDKYSKQMPKPIIKPIIDADTDEDMVQFFVTQPKSQAEGGREDY